MRREIVSGYSGHYYWCVYKLESNGEIANQWRWTILKIRHGNHAKGTFPK